MGLSHHVVRTTRVSFRGRQGPWLPGTLSKPRLELLWRLGWLENSIEEEGGRSCKGWGGEGGERNSREQRHEGRMSLLR